MAVFHALLCPQAHPQQKNLKCKLFHVKVNIFNIYCSFQVPVTYYNNTEEFSNVTFLSICTHQIYGASDITAHQYLIFSKRYAFEKLRLVL